MTLLIFENLDDDVKDIFYLSSNGNITYVVRPHGVDVPILQTESWDFI